LRASTSRALKLRGAPLAARGFQGILAVEIAMRATWTLSVSRAPNRCYCAKQ
jgi:hypothetical protein